MRGTVALLLGALGPVLVAQTLPIRNHRTVSLPFLRVRPITKLPEMGDPPLRKLNLEFSISNEASLQVAGSRFIEEDGEMQRLNVVYQDFQPRKSTWIELPIVAFSGGVLDPVIDVLHGIFLGLADPVRDRQPQGRAIVRTHDVSFGSGIGIGGITLGHAREVGGGWVVSGAIKIPVTSGQGLFDTGNIDAGLGAGKQLDLHPNWKVDLHAGVIRQGGWRALGAARPWVDHETVSLTYLANSKDTWILQFQSERSALRQFIPTSDAVHRMGTLAFRRKMADGSVWTLFISEDYDPINNINPVQKNIGPDVVLGWYVTINSR